MPINVGVVGSRTITSKEYVFSVLDFYLSRLLKEGDLTIISGGAKGVDSLGVAWAKERGLQYTEFLPDWNLGKGAGFIRNQTIVDNSDYLIAITTGSNGTADTIKRAEKKGIPIKIVNYDNRR